MPPDSVIPEMVLISYRPADCILLRSPKDELLFVLLPITSSCICITMIRSPISNESSFSSTLATLNVVPEMDVTLANALTL